MERFGTSSKLRSRLARVWIAAILAALTLAPSGWWQFGVQPLKAAISVVQISTQVFTDGGSTIAPSLTGVTSGNLLILVVGTARNPATDTSPLAAPASYSTAIATNTIGSLSYRPAVAIFYRENAPSGTNNPSVALIGAGSYAGACLIEVSGMPTTGTLDVSTSANSGDTGVTSGNSGTTGTTGQNNELAIAVIDPDDASGATAALSSPASSGYTNICNSTTNSSHNAWQSSYKILSATGTQTASWTWTGASRYAGAIATFKDTSGGAGSATPARLPLLGVGE